jgi:hypothetical protein
MNAVGAGCCRTRCAASASVFGKRLGLKLASRPARTASGCIAPKPNQLPSVLSPDPKSSAHSKEVNENRDDVLSAPVVRS